MLLFLNFRHHRIDYVAPMNVLWTYHFIHGNTEVAETIWQDYVKKSNQIMFQKVICMPS